MRADASGSRTVEDYRGAGQGKMADRTKDSVTCPCSRRVIPLRWCKPECTESGSCRTAPALAVGNDTSQGTDMDAGAIAELKRVGTDGRAAAGAGRGRNRGNVLAVPPGFYLAPGDACRLLGDMEGTPERNRFRVPSTPFR